VRGDLAAARRACERSRAIWLAAGGPAPTDLVSYADVGPTQAARAEDCGAGWTCGWGGGPRRRCARSPTTCSKLSAVARRRVAESRLVLAQAPWRFDRSRAVELARAARVTLDQICARRRGRARARRLARGAASRLALELAGWRAARGVEARA
jgi:hypothetical protein